MRSESDRRSTTAPAPSLRFWCPISGWFTTLGITGVRLDRPYRLVFHPGPSISAGHSYRAMRWEPNEFESDALLRTAGRILAPGCVINSLFTPSVLRRRACGLRLVAVEPGEPGTWITNQPLPAPAPGEPAPPRRTRRLFARRGNRAGREV